MAVDIKLLKQDVVFPIKKDEWGNYIWDNDQNMIAMLFDEELYEKIVGNYKEAQNNSNTFKLKKGEFVNVETREIAGLVRGWGRLQYKDKPEKRQDNIAEYLLSRLNEN